MAGELQADGLNAQYQPSDEHGRAEVVVIEKSQLDALAIHAREVELRTLAAEFGCHYHGWGASLLTKSVNKAGSDRRGAGWWIAKLFGLEEFFRS